MGTSMIPLRRRIRQWWRIIFPPRALRIPGKWPWAQPPHLERGTMLIEGEHPIVADGNGGVMAIDPGLGCYWPLPGSERAYRRRTR